MTNRRLIVLVLTAAVMVLLTALLYFPKGVPRSEFKGGTYLIQGLDPAQIGSIVIKKGDETVKLVREADGFVLPEKNNYPVSVEKINDLIVRILEVRCTEKVTDDRENHSDLGVAEGDEAAISLIFMGADDKRIVGLVKGKSPERGGGAYARLLGDDTVYRTEGYFYINTRPMDYVEKNLVSVSEEDIKRVVVKSGDETYTVERDDKGDTILPGIPEGKRAKGTAYEDVFSALTNLDMRDVDPAGKLTLDWEAAYSCKLKSGLTYRVRLAEKSGKHYAKLSAQGPAVKSVEITKTESEEDLEKKESVLLAVETARKFTPHHAPWVYEISDWAAGKMRKKLDELVEDIPAAEAPEEIAASHILIAYEGAERSEAGRTKEEAKKLAGEVHEKALAEGADFAALAREYSDGPSKDKGGDLGTFKKGVMAPAFEEAAFKLEVGEISELVETPFGFHIIKRTE